MYGGAYKTDNVKDLRILGLKNKKPKSRLSNKNKLILPNHVHHKINYSILKKMRHNFMWGRSLPDNLAIKSWRFYSTRIKKGLNNLRK